MGWEERVRQLRGSPIIAPSTADRRVHISDISKEQLARALNEQAERFKLIRAQLEIATRVLVAIALDPDALQHRDGFSCVETTALDQVKNGMTLRMDTVGDVLRILVDKEAAPNLVLPTVTVPV
jgi:hypothetical protein